MSTETKFDRLKKMSATGRIYPDKLDAVADSSHRDVGPEGPEMWWAIYFDEYGLHGGPGNWSVVWAEDGTRVDGELEDLSLSRALRRMKNRDLI